MISCDYFGLPLVCFKVSYPLHVNRRSLQYIDRDGKEYFYKNDKTHETKDIAKKLTLLGHFMHYMHEHLLTVSV